MTPVNMVEEHDQCHEHDERGRGNANHQRRVRWHETHEIAGIRTEEVQIGRQNRLITNLNLKSFDYRNDRGDCDQYRRGYPETIAQHEQHQIDDADHNHVQQKHEIQLQPHFRDEVTQTVERAGQRHPGAGQRHAPLQNRNRKKIEYQEQHGVEPTRERLAFLAASGRADRCDAQFFNWFVHGCSGHAFPHFVHVLPCSL